MAFLKGLFGSSTSEEKDVPALPAPAAPSSTAPESAPAPAPKSAPEPPASIADGLPDFHVVLDSAGVNAEQRLRVQKAQDLLKSLPSGTTPALKREIVEAAFQAFDIPTQEIIRAAAAHIEALEAFVAAGERAKQEVLDNGNARVKELEGQIAEVRSQNDRAVAAQEGRAAATREEIARVEPVLAFFARETVVPAAVPEPARVVIEPQRVVEVAPVGEQDLDDLDLLLDEEELPRPALGKGTTASSASEET